MFCFSCAGARFVEVVVWYCGDSTDHRASRKVAEQLQPTTLPHKSGHSAPTNTCARTRIDSDINGLHRSLYSCSRCPPRSQCHLHLRPHPSPFFRPAFSSSSSRTSQWSKGWTRKASRSEEERGYISLPPNEPKGPIANHNGRRICDTRKHYLPPARHLVVPR